MKVLIKARCGDNLVDGARWNIRSYKGKSVLLKESDEKEFNEVVDLEVGRYFVWCGGVAVHDGSWLFGTVAISATTTTLVSFGDLPEKAKRRYEMLCGAFHDYYFEWRGNYYGIKQFWDDQTQGFTRGIHVNAAETLMIESGIDRMEVKIAGCRTE